MPLFRVLDGILIGTQDPPGKGGILLTDKKYKNVEVFLEIKPDWGCDGGLFLRSSEAGEAYQVMLDYLPGGNMGGVYGERLHGRLGGRQPKTWQKAWKREEWNTVRARIEGDVPHIQVWINGEPVTDFTDTGQPRQGRRHRGHARHPDALQQRHDEALGAGRLLALADDRRQGAAVAGARTARLTSPARRSPASTAASPCRRRT